MLNILDASSFNYSQTRKDLYLEFVLTKCIIVYNTILNSGISLVNDENLIRDEFLKYLQDFSSYNFPCEFPVLKCLYGFF